MSRLVSTLQSNLHAVQQRIASACDAAGRSPASVKLLAVTKYAEWDWTRTLADLHSEFGENRPQQLAERQPQLPQVRWHLIGQLQRNKVRQALAHADVIHSVDSLKLLQRIVRVAEEDQRQVQVLLQVNVSAEASKSGFAPQQLRECWDEVAVCHSSLVQICGLMTMAPLVDRVQDTRPVFAELAALQQELHQAGGGPQLTELSMGMSRDFEIAIQEGATMVRVGRALYQGL